ncbi:retrovirus-related pol polyprotein from transposon TNT 1-94, partial [Tanacetum coccineum]
EYYYADHMNAILGVYTTLDEFTDLQCDYVDQVVKCEHLKDQLQDKDIAISELKKLIEKMKGKSVETKFEKPSAIRQPNVFKSQRQSVLGKPSTFLDSLAKTDFSKSKSDTTNNVSNDFSNPVTAQILPQNVKSILKNTNVIAPGIVSRPQLKSNRLEDRVMHNNSEGKKQQVEDHRRNFNFSNNKTFVTACNDSLNAKTSNVNFVCVTCGKCVLNDNHDMCVLNYINGVNTRTKQSIVVPISTREPKRTMNQSVATPLKKLPQNPLTRNLEAQLGSNISILVRHVDGGTLRSHYEDINGNLRPLVEIILFVVDSGCSNHMTRNLKLLSNIVEQFLGTLKFGYDQIAPILGYGDLVQGNVTIKWVYYIEGLNHNLFSVGQFCDANLEVAFRKSTCYIRDLKGNDLLTSSSSQAWLWHHRLLHLNFDTINLISKYDIVTGLPKLKFVKDHLCSSCELGKAKRKSFKTKTTPSSKKRLQILPVDLCGPMRVEIFNVRTDKGTKFLNKTLHVYFAQEGIEHQASTARTPEQNGVVERRNCTLVEAAQTMLSAAKVPLFFWAEAIATACFIQNHSLIIPRHEKTPYHIINGRKSSIKFFYIFGMLCYIIRDGENLDKMKEKGDACIFVGYSTQSGAYRVYNKRRRVIGEAIHVNFDELTQMASDHVSSDPVPQCPTMALEHDSLSPGHQSQENIPQEAETVTTSNELDLLFCLMLDDLLNETTPVLSKSSAITATDASNQRQQHTTPSTSTTVAVYTLPLNIQTTPETTSQAPTQALTVTATENINQAKTNKENAQVEEDEFIN